MTDNAQGAPSCSLDKLVWMGEDGQWIGCQGHVDLTEFAEAANALSRRDMDLDDEGLPWPEFEPWHAWYRPMTWEWYERHAGETATRSTYAAMVNEGALEACEPTDEGAEPWTMIATGA